MIGKSLGRAANSNHPKTQTTTEKKNMIRRATEENGLMSFEEIGRQLGVSKHRAHVIYQHVIEKLRRDPRIRRKIENIVALRRAGF